MVESNFNRNTSKLEKGNGDVDIEEIQRQEDAAYRSLYGGPVEKEEVNNIPEKPKPASLDLAEEELRKEMDAMENELAEN